MAKKWNAAEAKISAEQKASLLAGLMDLLEIIPAAGEEKSAAELRLEMAFDLAAAEVLAYCRLQELPEFLEPVFSAVVIGFYRGAGNSEDAVVRSVSRGDVSISYEVGNNGEAVVLQDYAAALAPFRSIGW